MKIKETISKITQTIHEHGADEEIFDVLNRISEETMNQERLFRDIRDVEIFLDNLRNTYGNKTGNINLYPSNEKGSCKSFCLAIATRPFEEKRDGLKTGFKGLMLSLCAYWIGCLPINRTTLILTSDWNTRKFADYYKEIIDNYVNVHGKKVFIVEVDAAGFFLRYPY